MCISSSPRNLVELGSGLFSWSSDEISLKCENDLSGTDSSSLTSSLMTKASNLVPNVMTSSINALVSMDIASNVMPNER